MIVIEDGLKDGENVVVSGQLALSPGMKINPQPAPQEQHPPASPASWRSKRFFVIGPS